MNIRTYILLFLLYLLSACDENKPIIPCLSCDMVAPPMPGNTVKKVLLEEFTGVRCVNCPQAQTEIKNLQSEAVYGENLVAVAYHAGFFSEPYSDSQFDFRTDAGEEILSFLETPIGYPSAVINRRRFDGNPSLQIIQFATWGGFVAQALEDEAQIALMIDNTYSATNRQLETTVSITPLTDITEAINLTVLLIEDDVIDVQLTPDGIINDYAQNHVFRAMLTNTLGNPITSELTVGNTVTNNFSFSLPEEWVAANCSIIAFVHQTGVEREILQVEEQTLER